MRVRRASGDVLGISRPGRRTGLARGKTLAGRPFRGVAAAGTLAAGFVLSHWLTYLIVVPRALEREHALESSGHGYWPFATAVAAALGLAALVVTARRAVAQARHADDDRQPLRPLVSRLSGMQVFAFILLEAIEHLSSGTPALTFVLGAPFLVGLTVQLIVAVVLAVFLSIFTRAATLIARIILRAKPAVRMPTCLPAAVRAAAVIMRLLGLATAGIRAPPTSRPRTQLSRTPRGLCA